MAQKTNSFERFWKELKRRKVVHVITIYAATAFVILELVSMVARPLKLPEWTEAFVIILLCIGFIISVFVSWIYDITPAGVRKTRPVNELKHVDHTTHAVSGGWKIATYVSAAIILALVAFNFINRRNLNSDILKLEKTIAVLPFRNDSPDSTNLYFCNSMMEEILTQLQKNGTLRVKSRTSGERYRHPDKDIKEIGRELGVSFIVEGSVRKAGNDLRITAQLINAKNGNHIWADTYNGEYTDKIFEFQNNVAIRVATSLNAVLTAEEKQRIRKKPTANLAAYDLWLRANDYLNEYEVNRDLSFHNTAVNLYKKALEIDPAFAKAYTGLARSYYDRYQWETYFKKDYLDSMLVLANLSLSIDDQLDEAYYIKGRYYQQNGSIEEALFNYDKALKISPSYFLAFYQKASILIFLKQDYVKGLESIEKSLNLLYGNELPIALNSVGYVWLMVGFPEKAKYYYQEALKLDEDSAKYFRSLVTLEFCIDNLDNVVLFMEKACEIDSTYIPGIDLLSFAGQDQKAYLAAKKRIEQIEKTGELPLAYSHRIGYAFYQAGKREEAKYYFNQQIKYGEDDIKRGRELAGYNPVYYDLAAIFAFLGDKVKAYQYLDEYNKYNFYSSIMLSFAKHDVLFDKIRNEERFQKILQNMEAKYQAEHERVRKWLEETGQL